MENILADGPLPDSQVQVWAEVLGHELNHHSRDCLDRQVACEVFRGAKPAIKVSTLRKRRETFDWINELTMMLMQVWAVHLAVLGSTTSTKTAAPDTHSRRTFRGISRE